MTPTRLRECLTLLDWSQRGVAALIQRDERQVRRWAAGQGAIPDYLATWLETLAAVHVANPPPEPPNKGA